MSFDGGVATVDEPRLTSQLDAVRATLRGGKWWTLVSLAQAVAKRQGVLISQTGLSARLRDLRKAKFGAHVIERRCLGGGLYEYRMA